MSRGQIPAAVRREVALREGVRPGVGGTVSCHYCGAQSPATWPLNLRGHPSYWPLFGPGFGLDHVLAVVCGGLDVACNLVIACGPCNSAKRDHPREGFRSHSRAAPEPLRNHAGAALSGREGKGRDRSGLESALWLNCHSSGKARSRRSGHG